MLSGALCAVESVKHGIPRLRSETDGNAWVSAARAVIGLWEVDVVMSAHFAAVAGSLFLDQAKLLEKQCMRDRSLDFDDRLV